MGAEQSQRPRLAVFTNADWKRGQTHRLGHVECGHDGDEGVVAHEVQPDPPGPIDAHLARQCTEGVGECFGAVLEVGRFLAGHQPDQQVVGVFVAADLADLRGVPLPLSLSRGLCK
jgi:hypothetical protein